MSLPAGKVASHFESAYGARVAGVAELDRDMFRVERRDGPAWVVRVFPPERPVHAVEGDAEILRNLESAGFPAERCAAELVAAAPRKRPTVAGVSILDGRGVLVTDFVDGIRPDRPGRTFAILGALLGRLHAHPAVQARPGGAWHHLAPVGVPADEIDAALTLLQSVRAGTSGSDSERCELLVVVPGVPPVGRRGTRSAAGGRGRFAVPQAHPADRGGTGPPRRSAARPGAADRLLVGRCRPQQPERGGQQAAMGAGPG